jgi:NADH-quinone oxidoreductase subunit K
MTAVTLSEVLTVAAALFVLGLVAIFTRKNAIGILMGVELVLNSANLNLVAFSRFHGLDLNGHVFVLFVILLAAIEAAVFLAICLAIYRRFRDIAADQVRELQG